MAVVPATVLEFCREDGRVEVTPVAVQLREVRLDQTERAKGRVRSRSAARREG